MTAGGDHGSRSAAYLLAKRLLDLTVAVVGLLLAAPLMAAIAVWIKRDSPGPVLYRGERVGRHGERFRIFKFRSLVEDAEQVGGPTTSGDDPRLTRSGAFIRRYNLDELPQLINVAWGQMSLVGPRPDVPEEIEKIDEDRRRRILSVRPGMTDWASIRFNDEAEIVRGHEDPHEAYEEMIRPHKRRLQERYVREASMATDLAILGDTIRMMLGRDVEVPDTAADETAQRS